MSHLEKTVDMKIINLEKTVLKKLDIMGEKINNLQNQRPEPVRIVSEGSGRIDGSNSRQKTADMDGTKRRRLWN